MDPLNYRLLAVTPFAQNATLLWREEGREAVVIDPGGEAERLLALIDELQIQPQAILLTHGHLDHVGASAELAAALRCPILGPHRDDAFLIEGLEDQCQRFGFPPVTPFIPDRWLEHGERIALGAGELEVLHCPGHTPGHLVYFERAAGLAQVGDVLFRGAIGRTDFPRGNHRQLLDSIRERLFPLGDEVRFIPGHGPMSTFGRERRSNPYVGDTRGA